MPDGVISELENAVNDISEEVFGSRILNKNTEFHGIEICRGKGNFKGRGFEERLLILERLLVIIAREDICRIKIRILPENIVYTNDDPSEIAFMYLIEQVDSYFIQKESRGMIFGDYDEPIIGRSVASLSEFRRGGTSWAKRREIANVIDTVHFAQSHHSRLIQLADIFLYCTQFLAQPNESNWRKAIATLINKSGISLCQRSKTWPQEAYWYR